MQREDDQDADEVITEAQGIAVPLYLGVLAGGVICYIRRQYLNQKNTARVLFYFRVCVLVA